MASILLRDRPDPLPPTVYEKTLVDSYNKFNINSSSGYISIGHVNNLGIITSGYVTGWNTGCLVINTSGNVGIGWPIASGSYHVS